MIMKDRMLQGEKKRNGQKRFRWTDGNTYFEDGAYIKHRCTKYVKSNIYLSY